MNRKNDQFPTNTPTSMTVLDTAQETVIGALLAGTTQHDAALLAGVRPETVSRWMRDDALFVATLNERRLLLWRAQQEKLRTLAGKAIDTLAGLLDSGDPAIRLKTAAVILKAASLDALQAPSGDTAVEAIELSRQEEAGRRRTRALLAELCSQ